MMRTIHWGDTGGKRESRSPWKWAVCHPIESSSSWERFLLCILFLQNKVQGSLGGGGRCSTIPRECRCKSDSLERQRSQMELRLGKTSLGDLGGKTNTQVAEKDVPEGTARAEALQWVLRGCGQLGKCAELPQPKWNGYWTASCRLVQTADCLSQLTPVSHWLRIPGHACWVSCQPSQSCTTSPLLSVILCTVQANLPVCVPGAPHIYH